MRLQSVCMCVFVIGVCVCVLVVGNASMIDLLLYCYRQNCCESCMRQAIRGWPESVVGPEHLRLHDRKGKRKERRESG